MKYSTALLIACFFLFSSCDKEDPYFDASIYSCTSEVVTTHPKAIQFQAFLEEKVVAGLPGISMLIETPDGIWTGAAGKAELQFQTPMQPCNVHRIGSVNKTFTATVILQLYQEGLLDLEDKISSHLPSDLLDGIANYEEATIRHLLTHSSGMPDYLEIAYSLNYYNDNRRVWTDEEELYMIKGEAAEYSLGEYINYKNTNYLLLGMIAKHITGKSGDALYQERIFNRVGMPNTYFSERGVQPLELVRGYLDEDGKGNFIDVTERAFVAHSMAGGASSTVEDLYKFQKAIWTTNLLVEDSTKQLIQTIEDTPFLFPEKVEYGEENAVNRTDGFGLCWWKDDTDYGKCYWHGGSLDGRRCMMRYFPESKTSIVYMVNGSGASINDLFKKMRRNDVLRLVFE